MKKKEEAGSTTSNLLKAYNYVPRKKGEGTKARDCPSCNWRKSSSTKRFKSKRKRQQRERRGGEHQRTPLHKNGRVGRRKNHSRYGPAGEGDQSQEEKGETTDEGGGSMSRSKGLTGHQFVKPRSRRKTESKVGRTEQMGRVTNML